MKRVCVIGAGVSGLPTIKSCIEEGLHVTCYEQSDYVGGLWRYREEVEEDTVSVFRHVILSVSKEIMAYSDYPPPVEYPVHLRNGLYYEYLQAYCDRFNLKKCIKFRHKVLEVVEAENYDSTGNWKILVSDLENMGRVATEFFDYVLVCSGHHTNPIMPVYPGQHEFKGKILHSKEYKRPEPFQGMKVLVVGFGNSAIDIATDIGPGAKQVYLSTRNPGWILPRYTEGSKIFDHELYPRWLLLRHSFLPFSFLSYRYENMVNGVFDHKVCGINPAHRLVSQRPVVNDVLPMQLLNGTVKLKPGIKAFTSNGVIFEGEDEVTEVDVVCYGTGFKPIYNFLKGMEDVDQYVDKIYRFVFPAHLKHQTLAFIGLLDPNLSLAVCAELQSRWVARIISGNLILPSKEEMLKKAHQSQEMIDQTCYKGFSQKTNVHGPPYLEEIAKDLGVRPNLTRLLLTDPKLFLAVFFGPLCAFQYRIQGPHSWPGARAAILGLKDRAYFAMNDKTRSRNSLVSRKKRIFTAMLLPVLGIGFLAIVLQYSGFDYVDALKSCAS